MKKHRNFKFKQTVLHQAIGLACVSMATMPLLTSDADADSCTGGGLTTISVPVAGDACELDAGESVDVTAAGSITGTSPGVFVTTGVTAGSITNSGTISVTAGGRGISIVNGSTLTGAITYNTSALIEALAYGIYLSSASVNGGITNSGTIMSSHGIRILSDSTIDY